MQISKITSTAHALKTPSNNQQKTAEGRFQTSISGINSLPSPINGVDNKRYNSVSSESQNKTYIQFDANAKENVDAYPNARTVDSNLIAVQQTNALSSSSVSNPEYNEHTQTIRGYIVTEYTNRNTVTAIETYDHYESMDKNEQTADLLGVDIFV